MTLFLFEEKKRANKIERDDDIALEHISQFEVSEWDVCACVKEKSWCKKEVNERTNKRRILLAHFWFQIDVVVSHLCCCWCCLFVEPSQPQWSVWKWMMNERRNNVNLGLKQWVRDTYIRYDCLYDCMQASIRHARTPPSFYITAIEAASNSRASKQEKSKNSRRWKRRHRKEEKEKYRQKKKKKKKTTTTTKKKK